MKHIFNSGLRRLHEKLVSHNDLLLFLIYLFMISLSLKQDNLFLPELAFCGLIVMLTFVKVQLKNKK